MSTTDTSQEIAHNHSAEVLTPQEELAELTRGIVIDQASGVSADELQGSYDRGKELWIEITGASDPEDPLMLDKYKAWREGSNVQAQKLQSQAQVSSGNDPASAPTPVVESPRPSETTASSPTNNTATETVSAAKKTPVMTTHYKGKQLTVPNITFSGDRDADAKKMQQALEQAYEAAVAAEALPAQSSDSEEKISDTPPSVTPKEKDPAVVVAAAREEVKSARAPAPVDDEPHAKSTPQATDSIDESKEAAQPEPEASDQNSSFMASDGTKYEVVRSFGPNDSMVKVTRPDGSVKQMSMANTKLDERRAKAAEGANDSDGPVELDLDEAIAASEIAGILGPNRSYRTRGGSSRVIVGAETTDGGKVKFRTIGLSPQGEPLGGLRGDSTILTEIDPEEVSADDLQKLLAEEVASLPSVESDADLGHDYFGGSNEDSSTGDSVLGDLIPDSDSTSTPVGLVEDDRTDVIDWATGPAVGDIDDPFGVGDPATGEVPIIFPGMSDPVGLESSVVLAESFNATATEINHSLAAHGLDSVIRAGEIVGVADESGRGVEVYDLNETGDKYIVHIYDASVSEAKPVETLEVTASRLTALLNPPSTVVDSGMSSEVATDDPSAEISPTTEEEAAAILKKEYDAALADYAKLVHKNGSRLVFMRGRRLGKAEARYFDAREAYVDRFAANLVDGWTDLDAALSQASLYVARRELDAVEAAGQSDWNVLNRFANWYADKRLVTKLLIGAAPGALLAAGGLLTGGAAPAAAVAALGVIKRLQGVNQSRASRRLSEQEELLQVQGFLDSANLNTERLLEYAQSDIKSDRRAIRRRLGMALGVAAVSSGAALGVSYAMHHGLGDFISEHTKGLTDRIPGVSKDSTSNAQSGGSHNQAADKAAEAAEKWREQYEHLSARDQASADAFLKLSPEKQQEAIAFFHDLHGKPVKQYDFARMVEWGDQYKVAHNGQNYNPDLFNRYLELHPGGATSGKTAQALTEISQQQPNAPTILGRFDVKYPTYGARESIAQLAADHGTADTRGAFQAAVDHHYFNGETAQEVAETVENDRIPLPVALGASALVVGAATAGIYMGRKSFRNWRQKRNRRRDGGSDSGTSAPVVLPEAPRPAPAPLVAAPAPAPSRPDLKVVSSS